MGRAAARHKTKPVETRTSAPAPHGLRLGALAVGIAVLTFVAYSSSFDAALTMDSPTLVERDTRLREVSQENLSLVWSKNYWWPSRPSNLFRPLTTLSFLFNYSVLGNGPQPTGYHVVNLMLHALNALLAFALVRRVTGQVIVAMAAAAVFALHPMATEAVTNVAGRADLLATASVLGGVLLHIESTRRGNPWPWRSGLLAVALLGVFAKESAVVMVPVIVLYDLLIGKRPRLVSYALLGAVLGLLFTVRRTALADMAYYRDHFLDNPLFGLGFVASRLTALKVMAIQLGKLVWPATLSCDYSYHQVRLFGWGSRLEDALAVGGALLVAALLAAAWLLRNRQPAVAFFIAFYFATLLPTSNLLLRIGSIMADRFVYLPSVGFAAALAIGVHTLAVRWAGARPGRPPAERVAVGLVAILAVAYAARTHVRNRDWRSEEALFEAARQTSPRSYKAHKGVANALLADKPTGERLDRAIAAAETGLAVIDERPLPPVDQPSDLMAALGLAYILKGDSLAGGKTGPELPADARGWYGKAVAVMERAVVTDRAVNERVKEAKRAAGMLAEVVKDVGLRRVHGTLGNAYMRLGEHAKALEAFTHLRRLDPLRGDGYTQSAWALAEGGRFDEAAVLLLQAMLLDPQSGAGSLLADVYQRMNPPITLAGGSLDVAQPRVKGHIALACEEGVRLYRGADRPHDAADLRQACVSRYALPAEPLDRALAGR